MDDLTRLFQLLVTRIVEETPERLGAPFQVSELYQRYVPYRHFKASLGFDTIEDYEMTLLRLLAGERDLAVVEPDDARDALRHEAEAISPETGAFREFAAARVTLSRSATDAVLGPDAAYRPPAPQPPPPAEVIEPPVAPMPDKVATDAEAADAPAQEPEDTSPPAPAFEALLEVPTCSKCAFELPPDRVANFCPRCGAAFGTRQCTTCGDAVEEGWRFCLSCGHQLHR